MPNWLQGGVIVDESLRTVCFDSLLYDKLEFLVSWVNCCRFLTVQNFKLWRQGVVILLDGRKMGFSVSLEIRGFDQRWRPVWPKRVDWLKLRWSKRQRCKEKWGERMKDTGVLLDTREFLASWKYQEICENTGDWRIFSWIRGRGEVCQWIERRQLKVC